MNPLLSTENQGRAYVIKAFVVRPEVTLLTDDNKNELRYFPHNGHGGLLELVLNEAQFGDTLPVFMEKVGLLMKQDKDGK